MVPKCPVCGGNMAMHFRCDQYFVEDENWHEAAGRYGDFLKKMEQKRGVLLELGVDFNTPTIIRFRPRSVKTAESFGLNKCIEAIPCMYLMQSPVFL